ncbi:hypothetical protein MMC24_001822 [Lignoscripta atroalba]|nr:hypothetical protein [Lignoscripta atroalba]
MAQSSRVAMILGAGPGVGTKVAQRFSAAGYKVAVVSRSGKSVGTNIAALSLPADFSEPKSVHSVFEEVRKQLGQPSVVVYNAAAICLPPASDPLSVDLETFQQHLAINTTSTYAASQEAVRSFDAIADKTVPCTFIYTGNKLSTVVMAPLITLGVGKAASAHFIEMAAGSYAEKGYGFFYADERTADGQIVGNKPDGDAAAEFYYELANRTEPRGYHQTFVKGKGFVQF